MKTKIVFSVVGGKKGIYLPQALIAVYSCRRHNPGATILLVVDQDTAAVIEEDWGSMKKYVSEVVVADTPKTYSNMLKSRFLKTSLRQNVEGDFLYIDTDTVITGSLASADEIKDDICAVLDRHSLVSQHELLYYIKESVSAVGLSLSDLHERYFNSGVMYVKDSEMSRRFFDLWHKYWKEYSANKKGIDQPVLAMANRDCGYPIVELDGVWNCQVVCNFVNYLSGAKILHYFATNGRGPYLLQDDSVFEEVGECHDIPEWLAKKLEDPKRLFCDHQTLAFGEDIPFLTTYVRMMYVYHRWVFRIFDYISRCLVSKRLF